MNAFRENEKIVLTFSPAEKDLILKILRRIRKNYEVRPEDMDAKGASVWYSNLGCKAAGMTAEETADWLGHLYEFRGAHRKLLDDWITQIESQTGSPWSLTIPLEQAPNFLAIVNDHRLLVAARHDLGEAEMGLDFIRALTELKPERQLALCEVDLLAHIMETVLWLLPGSGADWRSTSPGPAI
jgi:hypothetical protein